MKPYIIAICHQKGGVAKTTTTLGLAACLVEKHSETLIIDLDPQANLTSSVGLDVAEMKFSIAEALLNNIDLKSIILETNLAGLDIIPSNTEMLSITQKLFDLPEYEYRLSQALSTASVADYSFILLDCPPALGPLSFSALTAADMLIIPTQCEYFSIQALGEIFKTIHSVRATTNPQLLYRLLVTMFDGRGTFHKRMLEKMQAHFEEGLMQTVIGFDTKLREAQLAGVPITIYAPQSRGAQHYSQLADELLVHIQNTKITQQI